MANNFERHKDKIVAALNEIAALRCPRCGHPGFTLADGFVIHSLSDHPRSVSIGGRGIPSVVVICDKCGFMAFHALGSLGLKELIKSEDQDEKLKETIEEAVGQEREVGSD